MSELTNKFLLGGGGGAGWGGWTGVFEACQSHPWSMEGELLCLSQ